MFTDSKQGFDIITRGKRPTEKRLAIDITAACEAYQRFDIDRVGLVRGNENPADALRKLKNNGAISKILRNVIYTTPVESWIMRTNGQDLSKQPSFSNLSNVKMGGGAIK